MEIRLKQFNLEVPPEKTKLLEFGIFVQPKAKVRGEQAAIIDFLEFTHYCSRSRDGRRFRMKRKTISKRYTAKLIGYKEWLRSNRILTIAEILKTTAAKLRGYFACYGVSENSKSIRNLAYQMMLTSFKWLNRRGKRGCYNWEKFFKQLELFPLPKSRIMVNLLLT